jgi:heme/copper-type cytochrome/quinol oxidase subunit 3
MALALPPAPAPARPRVLMTATALAIVGCGSLFAGLLGLYATYRSAAGGTTGAWLPDGVTVPLTPGNVGAATLVMSSVIVQWAVYAIGNRDRLNAYLALGLTLVLGAAFMVGTSFLYTQIGASVRTTYGVLLYAVSGAHLAMLAAAMVYVALMAFRVLGGQFSGKDREGVAAAAMFWHFTVAAGLATWYTLYILK